MSEDPTKLHLRLKGRLMSASEIERTLVRLAHEIVEKSNGSEDLALVGIKRRGVPLAERLGKLISGIEKRPVETGVLDIQFYRDDLIDCGAPGGDAGSHRVRYRRPRRGVVRRRALYGPDDPGGAGCAVCARPAAARATGGVD